MKGLHDGWMARGRTGIQNSVEALVAELAARRAVAHDPATTLRIKPSGIDVLRREGPRRELVLEVMGRAQEAVQDIIARLGAGLPKDCGLEFAPGVTVTNEMVLPAESPDVLKAIVRNKVEGFAPWPLPECLFGQRIADIAGDPAHVVVDVAVVSRALLQDVTSALSDANVSVNAAHVLLQNGDSLRLDFGGEDGIRRAQQRARRLASGLAVAASLIAIYGFFLVWQTSRELAWNRDKTVALIDSLRGVGSVRDGITIVAAANLLHEQRQQRAPAVAVLNEVSAILPQTAWLESLSLDGARVELKGKGTNVPELIDVLEGSDVFSDVNFEAATELNEEQNADAFSIGATLEPGGLGGSAP
jgi:general secretion pathway protein L